MSPAFFSRGPVAVLVIGTLLFVPAGTTVRAQERAPAAAPAGAGPDGTASVPRLIQFSGQLRDRAGQPLTGAATVTFSVYSRSDAGPPLWVEVQTVDLDRSGRYTVFLGGATTGGIPADLFGTTEERWLGVGAPGLPEGPRTLLVSVPYALKAQDAETLGGKPASAYVLAPSDGTTAAAASKSPTDTVTAAAAPGGGSGDVVARTLTATIEDAPGLQLETRTGPPMVIRSTVMVPNLNADLLDGFHAAAFPRLAVPNTFTANQTIAGTLRVSGSFQAGLGLVSAENSGSSGIGFVGVAPGQNGIGMFGIGVGQSGIGVRGNGSAYGVFGSAVDTTVTGGIGVIGTSNSTAGIGVFADSGSATGQTRGLHARINSPSGAAGLFEAPSGANLLLGQVAGLDRFRVDSGGGLFAGTGRFATSTNAEALRSDSAVTAGYAIIGAATGAGATGVFGWATGAGGYGLYGDSSSGVAGVYGKAGGSGGTGGLFENSGGGDLLRGTVGSSVRFRVDNAGNVYASSFLGPTGTPIPNGDITSVAASSGLTGGGASGDVSLGLDTTFTDARYAATAHTHTVSQVSGAATLGANSFSGSQTVTGNVVASGKVEGASSDALGYGVKGTASGSGFAPGVLGVSTDSNGVGVRGEVLTTSGTATGVRGVSASSSGVGVRGEATSATGIGTGVSGTSSSDNGTGVSGRANTTGQGIGVRGESSGAAGMGVLAFGSSTTGQPVGLRAVVAKDGIAGTFEVIDGPGDLIVGRTGPISGQYTNRFRVDGSGAVYATAYKDLNGNPIPSGTGDITGVAASSGLTGGGASGDVSLGLDTAFTDTRYAQLNAANSFSGNQSVTGALSATGNITGGAGAFASVASAGAITGQTGSFTSNLAPGTVLAVNSTNTGSNAVVAIRGTTAGSNSVAIVGEASSTTGSPTAIVGNAQNGTGVQGYSGGTSGYGVRGQGAGFGGVGVFGEGRNTSSSTGIRGISEATTGTGVDARATAATGLNYGLSALTFSTEGTGVSTVAAAGTGNTFGLQAFVNSPSGTGARFQVPSGAKLLLGYRTGGPGGTTETFRVDADGAVFASSYRDLAGNPIPSGTGDITGVAASSGLTGGGASGDVSLGLDTAFTDARYAPAAHLHVVGDVAGAATLGANTFTGNQAITGNVDLSGRVTAASGVRGSVSAADAFAVRGDATATGDVETFGVHGRTASQRGIGVWGYSASSTGWTYGVRGDVESPAGIAVYGQSTASTGPTSGVFGIVDSNIGAGVRGEANASTGSTYGVIGRAFSTQGTGLRGEATESEGTTVGVAGWVQSAEGVAGLFDNVAGGNILLGKVNDTEMFRVDGTGAVYASSYRDLAGNPIPSGTGDITGVGVGSGLVGGGTTGDVTVSLDTAYTNNLYAARTHAHTVAEVAGAARLAGGNSFTGSQSVAGSISATGSSGTAGVFVSTGTAATIVAHGPVIGVAAEGQNSTGLTIGVRGIVYSPDGAAISGDARSATGTSIGVKGATSSSQGMAINGVATSPSGVTYGLYAQSSSPDGYGVLGAGTASTGRSVGVSGNTMSATGVAVEGQSPLATGTAIGVRGVVSSPDAVAGQFDNAGGGNVLLGKSGAGLSTIFRVDGTGAVYASSYRDLAGNPIPLGTGDITAVSASSGLTGGGGSGDVSLGLDTAFTDARYAAAAHTHTVGQVSGAATLGANAFSGDQSVTGNVTASGVVSGQRATFNTSAANAQALRSDSLATNGIGVYGRAPASGGTGVYAEGFTAVVGSGTSTGVFATSTGGSAVLARSNATTGPHFGVSGVSTSTTGTGVAGESIAVSGSTVGVRGTVHSPAGTAVVGVSVHDDGTAALFNVGTTSAANGQIIVGQSNGLNRFRVDATGKGFFNNGTQVGGADFAESVAVTGDRETYEPGDVLIIDATGNRVMQKSSHPYSTMVAGIYSTKPGVLANPYGMDDPRMAAEVPLAIIGIVPCKVSTENGAIAPGDLLVTSSTPGFAMKGSDRSRMLGAVVGKALEPLKSGSGTILVLVTLQ